MNILLLESIPGSLKQGFLQKLKNRVRDSVAKDRHLVYTLSWSDFVSGVWETSTQLLIHSLHQTTPRIVLTKTHNFVLKGGNCVSLIVDSSLIHNSEYWGDIKLLPQVNQVYLVDLPSSNGKWAIFHMVDEEEFLQSDCSQLRHLLQLFPLTLTDTLETGDRSVSPSNFSTTIHVFSADKNTTVDSLSRLFSSRPEESICHSTLASSGCAFSPHQYFTYLEAQRLGRVLVYADSMPSSYTLLEELVGKLQGESKLLIVSRVQTEGRGRGANLWISPLGQACFSFSLDLTLGSRLVQHLSFLQHLVVLALALAVDKFSGLVDVKVRIKWPNDLLYVAPDTGLHKMAGVLVNCAMKMDSLQCRIGVGFNLFNQQPTTCLQEVFSRHGLETAHLSVEALIAYVLNELERLVNIVESSDVGLMEVQKLYLQHWMHSEQEVTVQLSGDNVQVQGRVCGVDEFGFLLVKTAHGEVMTVHPDGNSFDMMRNLVKPK